MLQKQPRKIKQPKCRVCHKSFTPISSLQVTCNYKCAIIWIRMQEAKKLERKKKEENRQDIKRKKDFKNNDLPHQKKLTQSVFNKLRKLQELKWFKDQNLEPECTSCGKTKMDWCCGHYKTVASQGGLRFDELNTYLQCNRYCNKALSGNISGNKNTRGFTKGIIDRFGEKEAELIFNYLEKDTFKKWTCEELILMRKEFSCEIRLLEKFLID